MRDFRLSHYEKFDCLGDTVTPLRGGRANWPPGRATPKNGVTVSPDAFPRLVENPSFSSE